MDLRDLEALLEPRAHERVCAERKKQERREKRRQHRRAGRRVETGPARAGAQHGAPRSRKSGRRSERDRSGETADGSGCRSSARAAEAVGAAAAAAAPSSHDVKRSSSASLRPAKSTQLVRPLDLMRIQTNSSLAKVRHSPISARGTASTTSSPLSAASPMSSRLRMTSFRSPRPEPLPDDMKQRMRSAMISRYNSTSPLANANHFNVDRRSLAERTLRHRAHLARAREIRAQNALAKEVREAAATEKHARSMGLAPTTSVASVLARHASSRRAAPETGSRGAGVADLHAGREQDSEEEEELGLGSPAGVSAGAGVGAGAGTRARGKPQRASVQQRGARLLASQSSPMLLAHTRSFRMSDLELGQGNVLDTYRSDAPSVISGMSRLSALPPVPSSLVSRDSFRSAVKWRPRHVSKNPVFLKRAKYRDHNTSHAATHIPMSSFSLKTSVNSSRSMFASRAPRNTLEGYITRDPLKRRKSRLHANAKLKPFSSFSTLRELKDQNYGFGGSRRWG